MVNTHTLGGQAGFWGFLGSKAEFGARAVRCVEGPAPVGLAGGGRWRVRPDGAGASPSGVFATHLAHSFGRGETTQGRCVAEAAGGANSPASADRSPKLDSWFPLKKRPPPWEFLLWGNGIGGVLGALGQRFNPQPGTVD